MSTSKTAFISGVSGQDGAYLSAHLLERGYKVYGGARRGSMGIQHRLHDVGIEEDVEIVEFELTDQENVTRTVKQLQPDEFYNLAAQSFVGSSWSYPAYTSQANGLGCLYILEAIFNHSPGTRFYQASTSEMFGLAQTVPQREDTPFYPRSPYGVAKLYAHWITKNYRESHNLFTCCGILFNHESPLRGSEFVTRKITLGLARIAHGQQETLELGNLNAERDWGFAKEYVEGMALMLSAESANDYVMATGKTQTVRSFVEDVANKAGLELEWSGEAEREKGIDKKTGKVIVQVNPKFYRPAEVDRLVGDPSLIEKELGWKAKTELQELAELMYRADYDRTARGCVYY